MNDNLIISLLRFASILIPQPRPPRPDYGALLATTAAPKSIAETAAAPQVAPYKVEGPAQPTAAPATRQRTSCIPCSRSHLSTVSGALGESLRFAREGGVQHPEVVRRLALTEDEINILERVDLSADAIAQSPPAERDLARAMLPRIREVRQDIGAVGSVEDLEKVAAKASQLGQDFRKAHMDIIMKAKAA